MSGTEQRTLTGEPAELPEMRPRPATFVQCPECEEWVLLSQRFDHPHDLEGGDTPTEAQTKLLEEKVPEDALLNTQTYQVTYHYEMVETVRVEAASKPEAKRFAEERRTFDGEITHTLHTEKHAYGNESQASLEYLEQLGLLPDDHDVTEEDIKRLLDARGGDEW